MNNLTCQKYKKNVYLNILHNTSFSKSPKSLHLDKLVKRYKGYGGRDLGVKGRDLIEEVRDLAVMAKKDLIVINLRT